MPTEVTALAPAKINLFLRGGARRSDGYHPLLTVFQAIDLWEKVTARETGEPGIVLTVEGLDKAKVPLGAENLAVQAAQLVAREAGIAPRLAIDIEKRIPVAGGLAGGSADAAATLVACDELWRAGLGEEGRHRLAARLGSDVNFCLAGGTAIGRGRGEQLESVATQGALTWLLVTSRKGLSTREVFAQLDAMRGQTDRRLAGGPDPVLADQPPEALLRGLRRGDLAAVGEHLVNDLEVPALALSPELAPILDTARTNGALGATITGSGPTVIVLAQNPAHAQALAQAIGPPHETLITKAPASGARLVV
ncbi:MAG: 4-(cytidine 5'-diphospho)-2-C-methyl-D-erythritol kinase [Micrococcales bacterium]|nr:4-(cytidine 5'-diphospho)-2-C-methyl-D-erythritol kinase [Micrococcales bacterium]